MKTQKSYIDYTCGFPVQLKNIEMMSIQNKWTPNIKYNLFLKEVMNKLADKNGALTGNEVKFIRSYMEMTLSNFGSRFGVTHAAVKKWENKGDEPSNIIWAIEKDIRLYIIERLYFDDNVKSAIERTTKAVREAKNAMVSLYLTLDTPRKSRSARISIPGENINA